MRLSLFTDPNPEVIASPEHKKLFEDFGCEAYLIIFCQQMAEEAEAEEAIWERESPVRGEQEEDDDEVDYGFLEPDEYGE